VVDDSKLQRKILCSSLARRGYEVLQADGGKAALDILRTQHIDIVISDWMMPGMSGLELCNICRTEDLGRYIYFILLTSKGDKTEVARGLQAGADDFLTKPVGSHELMARISAGSRILDMQRQLTEKNRMIGETLAELQQLYDSLDSDLMQAKELQQSLLPERYKKFGESELSLMVRSCNHVGGDHVGFFQCSAQHLGLYAIDVSGHGVSSALMTARLAGYLSNSALDQNIAVEKTPEGYQPVRPSKAIERLNKLVLNEMETEHYFTLLLADINLETGQVCIGQAGHPRPVVQHADGSAVHVGDGGFPVGLIENPMVCEFQTQLTAGDRILIMSDGVSECENEGGQMMEEQGVTETLSRLKGVRGAPLLEAIMWELSEHAGKSDFGDDVSIISFEYQ